MKSKMREKWYGVTYPAPSWLQKDWFWNLWAKFMCPKGFYLLDECQSLYSHFLFCDACELDIPITEEEREEDDLEP